MRILVFGSNARAILNFRKQMLLGFMERGHEVHAMALADSLESVQCVKALGVQFHEVSLARTSFNPMKDIKDLIGITRSLRIIRPDAIFCFNIKPVIYGLMAAQAAGVPHRFALITGRGSALQGTGWRSNILQCILTALYRIALRGVECILFQNPDDRAFFQETRLCTQFARTAVVNGSGVDLKHFAFQPIPDGPVKVLMVARLIRDKGILEFIEATRKVKANHPEVVFQLLGGIDPNPSGVRPADLKAWIDEGLVEHLGEFPDVRPFLAAAHIIVLPSYSEGTPRSLLEAMATGRPIVTTDAPGCRETILDGINGLKVPVRDSAALADALTSLVMDPSRLPVMGLEGRRFAERKYDVHKVNQQIFEAMKI